jgi:hypothetical protein
LGKASGSEQESILHTRGHLTVSGTVWVVMIEEVMGIYG